MRVLLNHLGDQSIERQSDVSAKELYQRSHREPDDNILCTLVEARSEPELVLCFPSKTLNRSVS